MNLRVKGFAAGEGGASAVELGIGVAVVVATFAMVLDLYVRFQADGSVGRAATVMAEYAAVDPAPELSEMQALTEVLNGEVIGVPNDLAIVVSLIRKGAASDPPDVIWSDGSFQAGDQAGDVAQDCARVADGDTAAALPVGLVVVAEACAKLKREGSLSGQFLSEIYRLYVVPCATRRRPPNPLPDPAGRADMAPGAAAQQ